MISSINDLKIGELYQFVKVDKMHCLYGAEVFDMQTYSQVEKYIKTYKENYVVPKEVFLLLDTIKFAPFDANAKFFSGEDYFLKILSLRDNNVYTISAAYNGPEEKRFIKFIT